MTTWRETWQRRLLPTAVKPILPTVQANDTKSLRQDGRSLALVESADAGAVGRGGRQYLRFGHVMRVEALPRAVAAQRRAIGARQG